MLIRLYFAPEKNNLSLHLKKIPLKNFERLLEFKRIFNNTTINLQPQNTKPGAFKDLGVEFRDHQGTGVGEFIRDGSRRISDQVQDSDLIGNTPSDFLKFSDHYSRSRHSFSKWMREGGGGGGKLFSNLGVGSKASGSEKEGINSFSFEDNLNKFHETHSLLGFDNNMQDDDSLKGKILKFLIYSQNYLLLDLVTLVAKADDQLINWFADEIKMFQKPCKVINILLLVITRKIDPKSKLLFTDEFIDNFKYKFSQSEVCHFFNFMSKTAITGLIWQIQGNRPVDFSSYCLSHRIYKFFKFFKYLQFFKKLSAKKKIKGLLERIRNLFSKPAKN